MKLLRFGLPLFLLVTSCAAFNKERRLAEPDRNFRVKKVLVLPVMLTYKYCPEDVDKRARKEDVIVALTQSTVEQLKGRGYAVVPAAVDAQSLDAKAAHNADLGKALCAGANLEQLPPEVARFAAELAKQAQADQVFVGGIARMRWHLKMSLDDADQSGATGDNVSQFEMRAAGALYDVSSGRVVWSEFVDTKLFTGTYEEAAKRVLLFDDVKSHDPHEKLFYDFPFPEGAPAPN